MIEGLNPGIVKLVTKLREAGFNTCDSGDGETHEFDCDRDYGYVSILVPDKNDLVSETDRLEQLLTSWGIVAIPMTMEDPPEGCCNIDAGYEPCNELAIIDIRYVHDRMLTC